MKWGFGGFAALLLMTGCVSNSSPSQYSLTGGEKGVFSSRNAGSPIPLDRKDDPARALRYQSDACVLFVYLYRKGGTAWQAEFADAYDLHLRPLPVDQCAGSVAAQKKRVA